MGVGSLRDAIDGTTAEMLRARQSVKWTTPGPGGFGAAIAGMDFGAAPPVIDALERLSENAAFGYLPPHLSGGLAVVFAEFELRPVGGGLDPALIHPGPSVIKLP